MSRSKNQELCSWKDVLAMLRRVETVWRGISLSHLDHLTYTEAILLWGMVLNDLSNRYEGLGSHRDHVSMMHILASADVGSVATFVSDSIVLWRHMSYDSDQPHRESFAGFKRQLTRKYPFAGGILGPMRGAIEKHLGCPTPNTFYPVYQVFSFLNHLSLRDIDMSTELEDEYLGQEDFLIQHSAPDFLVQRMNGIMRRWLHDFRIESDDFVPGHGPGAVAELQGDVSLISKYRLVQPDSLIRYVFKKHADLDVDTCAPLLGLEVETSRESQIVFVPKSMKTKRVISKEPATLQYFQQGVDRCIRQYVAKHPYLSRRIDLRDQTAQRQAALEASRSGHFATVDLSAASDSVSFDLVKRVFRGTALYPFLVALRSRSTKLPSGRVVELTKFAPMGSSLTFPIETLIFACIAECTAYYVYHGLERKNFRYRVYGDDIIVPADCLVDLESNLRFCGFRLNEDKTYGPPYRFRESCGCDAYDGVDVTPMRIGRRFSARRVSSRTPDVFASLISMANSAYEFKFSLLRAYLVDKLLNEGKFVPLFSEDGLSGLYSPTPTNYRLPRRENVSYQRTDVRAATVVTQQNLDSPSLRWDFQSSRFVDGGRAPDYADRVRCFEWLRSAASSTVDPLDIAYGYVVRRTHIGSAGTYLARRWRYDPST